MQRLAALAAFALATSLAASAAAQGTMTPSQPPPLPPAEPAGTPAQPPVAQQATPAPAASTTEPPAEEPKEYKKGEVPPPRTGFQLGLRTGVAVPLGEVDKGESMSDSFTPQVPLIADVGMKVIPQLFLGGYVGLSVGGVGDALKKSCDKINVDCLAVGFRFGIEAQLHLAPENRWNPWVGYGIGYEIAGASGSRGSDRINAALGGFEFAHFMGGLDYRINKVVGIGPFADFALGQYSIASLETTVNGVTGKKSGDIGEQTLHEWLLIGVKVTFFP